MQSNTLIIISYYVSRNNRQLSSLLTQISHFSKNVLIVINDDEIATETVGFFKGYPAILRPNIGMNIGAWNATFQRYPTYKNYIFLQDECSLMRDDFISAYESELGKFGVGMTGESINKKWDKSWCEMLKSPLNYPVNQNLSRVEYYLYLMNMWGINPGITGRHLRSLVWGFSNEALSRLNGFPIGNTKEECIASEIAVSKKIEQLGLSVTQISDTPFTFFKHEEWRADGTSKI
jgi:hypothetical protein